MTWYVDQTHLNHGLALTNHLLGERLFQQELISRSQLVLVSDPLMTSLQDIVLLEVVAMCVPCIV